MPVTRHDDKLFDSIRRRLAPFSRGDVVTARWLEASVGRIMVRADGESIRDGDVAHVVDWIVASRRSDLPWTRRVGSDRLPPKLTKFADMESILREADEAMVVMAQRGHAAVPVEGDEELYTELGSSMRIVRLLTDAALDREGAAMGHCIGNGAYDEDLKGGNLYLSLRDTLNRPHATMEIRAGTLVQLQGKGNRPPVARYLDVLVPFLRDTKWRIEVRESCLGHVVDASGEWHSLDKLPEGLTVDGDLDLYGTEVTHLPGSLTVGRHLFISYSAAIYLSTGITVGGHLYGFGTKVTRLPDRLSVAGDIFLFGAGVTHLGENLSVGGGLYLSGSEVTHLPEGLTVGGNLNISATRVTRLPEGITVGGYLDISGTGVTAIPRSISDSTKVCFDGKWMTASEFRATYVTPA